ncbi:hypothetical protein DESC_90025 [Desulfosarcina cetonica]|nr:hypothetical protein DESC_90025 [Desulfosarcina cetonica]
MKILHDVLEATSVHKQVTMTGCTETIRGHNRQALFFFSFQDSAVHQINL